MGFDLTPRNPLPRIPRVQKVRLAFQECMKWLLMALAVLWSPILRPLTSLEPPMSLPRRSRDLRIVLWWGTDTQFGLLLPVLTCPYTTTLIITCSNDLDLTTALKKEVNCSIWWRPSFVIIEVYWLHSAQNVICTASDLRTSRKL